MKIDILLGLQWGDEGKGKIVDALSPSYDVVARFQGGPNAGHSLEFNNVKHVLHLIPSGIFHADKLNIIGNGVVLDPDVFKKEIEHLGPSVEELRKRLVISARANLILPTHRILDAAYENRKGCLKIGSTLKGIGPAYTDKASRNGLRVGDILKNNFRNLYDEHTANHLSTLRNLSFEFDLKEYEKGWFDGIGILKQFRIENTEYLINKLASDGKKVLAEGAQGTMLDLDFGSYPYVTSSSTISAGACTGLGISPRTVGDVFGIFKAYCTRVGSGPFPTELNDPTGELLNGATKLFMMKSDVLSGFKTIRVCTSYKVDGRDQDEIPFDNSAKIDPLYAELPGWDEDIKGKKDYKDLPQNLKHYVEFIENHTGIPVTIISVGPDRNSTIFR
jgi:adenylosuccinate synthase